MWPASPAPSTTWPSRRDIEAAFKAVKALGYEMVNDEIEFLPFWENGVRFFTFYGPNREKIEFSQIQ